MIGTLLGIELGILLRFEVYVSNCLAKCFGNLLQIEG